MSDYEQLKQSLRRDILDSYFWNAREVEKNSFRQYHCVIVIQKFIRMLIKYRKYLRTRKSILLVQRHIRGYLGRKRNKQRRLEKVERENVEMFKFFAVKIQKV